MLKGYCIVCGNDLPGRHRTYCSPNCEKIFVLNHFWAEAKYAAKIRDGWKCVKCGSTENLEVNHIQPVVGKGYGRSCRNHQENIEVLCRKCHAKVTRHQVRARKKAGEGEGRIHRHKQHNTSKKAGSDKKVLSNRSKIKALDKPPQ